VSTLDDLLPAGGLARGAVHEILGDGSGNGTASFALLLTAAAGGGRVAWSDPHRALYPFGLAGRGLDLGRTILLRPRGPADEVWAIAECLRCRGVGVVVAAPPRLSPVQARRLQLAAERGGSVGLLLRSASAAGGHYAAATRWRVEPAVGDAGFRRLRVQLVHGHGGRVGQSVLLEVCRETNLVRAADGVADRPVPATAAQLPA